MAKSLKEALLEKFADLQELGIAPTNTPVEDEGPAVVVEMGPENRGESGGRRQRSGRPNGGYDDEGRRGLDEPFRTRTRPRRPERGERPRFGGDRPRRDRPAADAPPVFDGGMAPSRPVDRPLFAGRPPAGDRPTGPRPGRPMGDRPPRPGMGPGPREGQPRHSVTDRLQQRAEQRRREEDQRKQLQEVITSIAGGEPDQTMFDKFIADLTVEVGALPPIDRLIEAIRLANDLNPEHVGQQIRMLYRRPRPRPAAVSS